MNSLFRLKQARAKALVKATRNGLKASIKGRLTMLKSEANEALGYLQRDNLAKFDESLKEIEKTLELSKRVRREL